MIIVIIIVIVSSVLESVAVINRGRVPLTVLMVWLLFSGRRLRPEWLQTTPIAVNGGQLLFCC